MSAEGIVQKCAKGNGYIVAKFHSGGYINLGSSVTTRGANAAGETVSSLNIVGAHWSIANNASWTIQRGGNTVLVLAAGQSSIRFDEIGYIDNMGGEPQANLVVTKTGSSPSTLILKIHKRSAVTGGSAY